MKHKYIGLTILLVVIGYVATSQGIKVEPKTNITVSSGSTLKIASGNLVLKSNASGDASLIDYGTVAYGNGVAKVQRYLSCGKWHLISSPVTNALSGMFAGNYLKYYNEPTASYIGIASQTVLLAPGKGYFYWNAGTGFVTKEFSGITNTGNVTFNYTKNSDGWNLVGNPYPSILDWDAVTPFLPSTLKGGISLYDPATNAYKYYIMGGGAANTATQYVSSGQGFLIQAIGMGSLTFTNAMRTHISAPSFYKSASTDQMIVLKVTGNNITTQTALRFSNDATADIDRLMDMCKIMETTPQVPALYTICQGEKMVLNSLPLSYIDADVTIPVYFEAGADGKYLIRATELESIPASISIYLEDIRSNYIQDLRLYPQYNFTYNNVGQVRNMLIHFRNNSAGVDETEFAGGGIICYNTENLLHVNFTSELFGNKEVKAQIEVFTFTGQQIYSAPTSSLTNQIQLTSSARAIYIVKVTYNNQVYVKKIIL
jgi:hypothetical protein